MKKTIITVVGHDTVGIIAKVCNYLAEHQVNIEEISQTILQGIFNMMMITDITGSPKNFGELSEGLDTVAEKIGMQIKMQKEDIFDAMHRV